MLRLRGALNFSLKPKFVSTATLFSSIRKLSRLYKIDCQLIILEIDSINEFNI